METEHLLERIFHEALALPSEQRREFVERSCSADSKRALLICELLDADASLEAQNELKPGDQVGPYIVRRKVGSGGMGSVYLAEQLELGRSAALKVVRSDLESRFLIGRFLVEQHALAQLSHPNIATLYEIGLTPKGQPFFAMEYVEGLPIDIYCDRHKLTIDERLRLFQDVCGAVHFVHNHTVIHRDIKAANVLVTDAGVVKLLDFGLAKPLAADPAGDTFGARWLTPAFASPEQIRRDSLTLQSDGYSLGVLLYYLLTGQLPFSGDITSEVERAILHDEPLRPSIRVAQLSADQRMDAKQLKDNASSRGGTPNQLSRRLRGDLDNIVCKALQKDPRNRYRSADQLSEDIGRYLHNLPVIARAPTWKYRTIKFVSRYRAPAFAGALFVLLLVAFTITVAQQRARADRRFNDVRHLANSFMFEFYEKIQGLPGTTDAQELVVSRALQYLNSLAEEASDPELVRELATSYERVGDVQGDPYAQSLGHMEAALKSYERSRDLRSRLPLSPSSRFDLAKSYLKIADIYWIKRKWEDARSNYQLARQLDEASARERPSTEVRTHLSVTYTGLGDTAVEVDDLTAAKFYHQQSLNVRRQLANSGAAPQQRNLAVGYVKLGDVLSRTGNLTEAITLFASAIHVFQGLRTKNINNEQYRSNLTASYERLGLAQLKNGDSTKAVESQRKALRLATEAYAIDKSNATAKRDLAATYSQLGDALLEAGRVSEAVVVISVF